MFKVVFAICVFFSISKVYAESDTMACTTQTYDCYSLPNGTQQCNWGSDLGKIYSIDLQKTGSAPTFETWEGTLNGTTRGFDYEIRVYQKRESSKKINYLTADLLIGKIKISGIGENTVGTRFFDTQTNEGIGIHCSMNVTPSDENELF